MTKRKFIITIETKSLAITKTFVVVIIGRASGMRLGCSGREILLCRCNCSPFMRAKLVAFFNVLGLNIQIISEIFECNPLMNDPKSIFYDQLRTRLPNLSNSFW